MNIRQISVALIVCALTLVAGRARSDDADFAAKALSGGMMEVQLGELAEKYAVAPDVMAFGRQMVKDHAKAGDRLRAIAREAGIAMSGEMLPEHRKTVEELSGLEGSAFDRRYVALMVEDHEKDVAAFRAQAKSGDSVIARWASETLPTLEHHLQMAREMARKRDGAPSAR